MDGKAICGYGNAVVIFEVEDGIFAFVNTRANNIKFNSYWLNAAKYEAIYDVSLLDEELVKKAEEQLKNSDFTIEKVKEMIGGRIRTNEVISEDQRLLLEQSRDQDKGIYLR